MKIVSLEERCCGSCEHWLGGRVIGECGHVYTLPEFTGICLSSGGEASVFGACEQWTAWRFEEDCFLQAAAVAPGRSAGMLADAKR